MRLLVLGGAGYIGSHFVKLALELDHEVIVVDNLLTGYKQAVDPKAKFYKVDIRDKEELRKVFKENQIDAVIHFAASSLVGESMVYPLKYFNNNVTGTIALLEVMEEFKVRKIVFSSSAATYGTHEKMPITEAYDTHPESAYGETKLMMEKIMKWSDVAYGLKYVSLRLSKIFKTQRLKK